LQDRLRNYIIESKEKDCFDYYDNSVVKKISKSYSVAGKKQDYWFLVFIRIYARIKDGHGIPDPNNIDGKIVHLPFGRKKYMAVFFKPEHNGGQRYTIYDYIIAPLSQFKQ